ncbi:MAG: hypothetical protein MST10_09110, partial [Lentisphaeria bacterium]|nr:hypothetical protein [Lentisphaeria bacterium]
MKELNFWFFWGIFKRCWKIMLISALLCGACTYCVNKFLLKPVYQAKVSLYLGNVKSSDEHS